MRKNKKKKKKKKKKKLMDGEKRVEDRFAYLLPRPEAVEEKKKQTDGSAKKNERRVDLNVRADSRTRR